MEDIQVLGKTLPELKRIIAWYEAGIGATNAGSQTVPIAAVRLAVADYVQSEGCSCCQSDRHTDDRARLAELLGVPKYKSGSGYDFSKFRTKL